MLTSNFFEECNKSKAIFKANGSFGELCCDIIKKENVILAENDKCLMTCTYKENEYGVFTRQDIFKNISDKDITVNSLKSRFVFDGGEYEVYTQFSNWQAESKGAWQPLVTGVTCACASTRSTQNATPMLVLWNKQQNRGVVFHLLPNSAWEMQVSHIQIFGKYTKVLVELGIRDYNLNLVVRVGEEVAMPQIICYETQNRLDFDCYKLHNYMHTNYPRKTLPFIYNTWMYRFTSFTPDQLFEQARLAAEVGLEYFVVDAGWFGKGGIWYSHVGDWSENKTGGLFGRMKELSDYVRSLGMKFGLWIEPERAGIDSDISRSNPEEFFEESGNLFLDFSNKVAYERILNMILGLIDEYNIEYIKFDYNANMYYDKQHTSFLNYNKYHTKFINELKEKYPDLYISACASGGTRMELANYIKYDSFWPTDNESPYIGMRIFKETILRLPPQGFEKWTSIHSMEKYDEFYKPFNGEYEYGSDERIIASGDAAWCDLSGVRRSYLKAYHTASPVGFSCDLSALTPDLREYFKNEIAIIKEERNFWQNAVARILADTETVTVYQYSDMSLAKNIVQIIFGETLQDSLRVYPCLNADKTYIINDENIKTGAEIMKEGIKIKISNWNEMAQIIIKQI